MYTTVISIIITHHWQLIITAITAAKCQITLISIIIHTTHNTIINFISSIT